MVKAVVTGFDGVICHWQPHKTRKVELDCKLEPGTFLHIRNSKDLLGPALLGQMTFNRWVDNVRERLIKRYGLGVAEHYVQAWRASEAKIDHALLNKFRELFPEARIVLAANSTNELPAQLARFGLTDSFDTVFNSSAMGVAKPAKQFFQAMLISMGMTAKDVLYVDDRPENVQTAKALGIPSYLYQSRAELAKQLTEKSLDACMLDL